MNIIRHNWKWEFTGSEQPTLSVTVVSKDYWKSLGWEHIPYDISNHQKNITNLNKNYWLDKGFSEIKSTEKIRNIQSERSKMRKEVVSHFQKSYWLDKGFSEKDYYKIIRKLNQQLEEFYDNKEDFLKFKKKFSNIMRDVWYRELPNTHKYYKSHSILRKYKRKKYKSYIHF